MVETLAKLMAAEEEAGVEDAAVDVSEAGEEEAVAEEEDTVAVEISEEMIDMIAAVEDTPTDTTAVEGAEEIVDLIRAEAAEEITTAGLNKGVMNGKIMNLKLTKHQLLVSSSQWLVSSTLSTAGGGFLRQ